MDDKYFWIIFSFLLGFLILPFIYQSFNDLDTRDIKPLDMLDYEIYSIGQITFAKNVLKQNGYDPDLVDSFGYHRVSTKGFMKPSPKVSVFPEDYFEFHNWPEYETAGFLHRGLDARVTESEKYTNVSTEIIIIDENWEISFTNITSFDMGYGDLKDN